jgi:hypothetical protein
MVEASDQSTSQPRAVASWAMLKMGMTLSKPITSCAPAARAAMASGSTLASGKCAPTRSISS